MEIKLVQTCGGCPEQYDAYLGENIVGYLRLRHGYFYVEHYCEVVYEARPDGDGMFTYEERDFYITEAKNAIKQALLERL